MTVLNTELATPSACPDVVVLMFKTFCAKSRVLRRLAATVAEIPWVCEGTVEKVGGGGGGVGRGVNLGRGMEGVVLVLAMEARVCTREARMGVVRGGVATEEAVEEREGTGDVRDETNCRLERLRGLGGVLGEGVRETVGGVALWPRRGPPERDCARERMSCWAAVWVEEEEGSEGEGNSPESGAERSCRERAAA